MPQEDPPLPRRLTDLSRDRRGFVVPAEAAWTEDGPVIETLGQSQTFALAFTRVRAMRLPVGAR